MIMHKRNDFINIKVMCVISFIWNVNAIFLLYFRLFYNWQ